MKTTKTFSDAIHILVFIEFFKNQQLSSNNIARSVNSDPTKIRRLMSNLRKSGIIYTRSGTASPSLLIPPSELSLLDIYNSILDSESIFEADIDTNKQCVIGKNLPKVLTYKYQNIQQTIENDLKKTTLADIIREMDYSINHPVHK